MALQGLDIAWFYAPPDAGKTTLTATYADFALARTACSAPRTGNYWECLGHLAWRPVKAAYTTDQTRVESFEGVGLDQLDVAVCAAYDVDCTMPWAHGQTDDAGLVTLQVPLPADGLASFTRTTSLKNPSSVLPTYLYQPWPLTEARHTGSYGRIDGDKTGQPVLTAADRDVFVSSAKSSGITLDTMRGTVAVSVQDCLGVRAPGVAVTLSTADDNTIPADHNLVRLAAPITGSQGGLIFLNVPVGAARMTAQLPGVGALGSIGLYVHASAVVWIIFRPTPI
jgi:hypothetical protein